jgi:hypothetical protein
MIEIQVPKETTFDLPEGCYRALVTDVRQQVKQNKEGMQDWVRIVFRVEIDGWNEYFNPMAGRSFKLDLNGGSDLRNFLGGYLGQQYFVERSGQRIDLDGLRGAECEVELQHQWTPKHKRPLVVVAKMVPPNTLKLGEVTPETKTAGTAMGNPILPPDAVHVQPFKYQAAEH